MAFFFFLPLLLSLPIFIYFCLIYKPKTQPASTSNPTNEKLPLPPGRTGWPLIGESIDYISKLQNGVPQDFVMERIKKYSSKVFKTSLLGQPMAILYGAEGNKFLFCNERKLVLNWFPPAVERIMIKSDSLSMNHQLEIVKLRKKVTSFINGVGSQKFVGEMDAIMRDHLKKNWDREEIKVCIEVRKYVLKLGLGLFLSLDDPKKLEKLLPLMDDLIAGINSLPIKLPGTAYSRGYRASELICEELDGLIRQRKIDLLENKATPTHDLLSHILLSTRENGEFMNNLILACSIQGLMAGSYPNLNDALSLIMKYLAELPHVYHEVLREQMDIANSKELETLLNWSDLSRMKYSWNVACEVMRLHPTTLGILREAITDFAYDGCTIPKGWKLHVVPDVTHKNPKYFPDPEKFDPSRFDGNVPTHYAFIPFGGGPRICPGIEFTKLAILVFMHNVVTKFKWEKVIANEKVFTGSNPKCSQGLPIRLYPHKP